jgi:hypothetical protein
MAVALDVAAGGELMSGTGLLLVPGTAAFMLVVAFSPPPARHAAGSACSRRRRYERTRFRGYAHL